MTLKQLVNNAELYKAFQNELEERIRSVHLLLETTKDPTDCYRLQGQIYALRRLKVLREEINNRG